MRRGQAWTDEEDDKLIQLVNKGLRDEQIAAELQRSKASVQSRRSLTHGIKRENASGAEWTEREERLLKREFENGLSDKELSELLGRTKGAIIERRSILGLKMKSTKHARWTEEEDQLLRDHTKLGVNNREVADELGRTPRAIDTRKRVIGLYDKVTRADKHKPLPKFVKRRIEQAKVKELKGNGVMRAKHDIDKRLKINNEYKVINNGNNYMNHASPRRVMKYLYSTKDLVVFQCNNYKETFRKLDIVTGNPTIRELN